MEWISVEDRLPEIHENDYEHHPENYCLVLMIDYGHKRQGMFDRKTVVNTCKKYRCRWGGLTLTHWMPLPDPPKDNTHD